MNTRQGIVQFSDTTSVISQPLSTVTTEGVSLSASLEVGTVQAQGSSVDNDMLNHFDSYVRSKAATLGISIAVALLPSVGATDTDKTVLFLNVSTAIPPSLFLVDDDDPPNPNVAQGYFSHRQQG